MQCINKHAPLKRTKITCPPAPWMKSVYIKYLQSERIKLRKIAHETKNENDIPNYRLTRTCLKQTIKAEKRKFYKTTLSSKKPKDVWKTIHRILKPNPKPITASPDDLNNYFSDIAENLTSKSPEIIYKSNLPDENYNIFTLKESNYIKIRKELKNIRNDCSTGFDCIPPDLIKPVSDYLASPLKHIINNCIKMRKFPKLWKMAKTYPFPKISLPTTNSDY